MTQSTAGEPPAPPGASATASRPASAFAGTKAGGSSGATSSPAHATSLKGFGLAEDAPEIAALGALLAYLQENARSLLVHLREFGSRLVQCPVGVGIRAACTVDLLLEILDLCLKLLDLGLCRKCGGREREREYESQAEEDAHAT